VSPTLGVLAGRIGPHVVSCIAVRVDSPQHGGRWPVPVHGHLFEKRQTASPDRRRKRRDRRQDEELGRCCRVSRGGWTDTELHDLARCAGSAASNSPSSFGSSGGTAGRAAAEGLVRPNILEDVVANGDAGEVDDHVGPLGETHEQSIAVVCRDVDRRGQEAALVADLPDLNAGDLAEVEDREARLAAVQEADAIAALLDGEERPCVPVFGRRRTLAYPGNY
jgi:hypothetical protein